MRVRKKGSLTFDLPLIPMIDCMLVIIIFFLVATTMKTPPKAENPPPPPKEMDLPIEVPESVSGINAPPDSEFFVIGIDPQGGIWIGKDPVSTEDFRARIREIAAANPAQLIRIKADRQASFESVLHVMDLCQFEGLHAIVFHTREVRGYGL